MPLLRYCYRAFVLQSCDNVKGVPREAWYFRGILEEDDTISCKSRDGCRLVAAGSKPY